MKHYFTAALLALPLLIPAAANAKDHDEKDMAQWHADMCTDRYAHAFGKLAFLQAKLGITDKQQDAWNKWQQAELDGAVKERDTCLADKPSSHPLTVVEQEDTLEKILSAKVDQLQAARGPLNDLYKVLSSDQKDEFDEFGEEQRHHWHHQHEGPKGEHGGPDHDGKPE